METCCVTPIGIIHSPFSEPTGMPVQPSGASDIVGYIDILPQYLEGLSDITGFERIILLYFFHRCDGFSLQVTPYFDTTKRGLFATRAPRRPNWIGFSVVRLIDVKETRLFIRDVDILDGPPLLDMKPYVPKFDAYPDSKAGWLEDKQQNVPEISADERFHS